MQIILVIACAYLVGSIPFSFLIGKAWGKDIRLLGSRNPGATNVFRTVGPAAGTAAFVLDTAKGFGASYALPRAIESGTGLEMSGVLAGIAVVAGHMWPVFLRFNGGKGVATALGVFLGLAPVAAALALAAWIVAFLVTGYVSVASMIAAVSLPLFIGVMERTEGLRLWTFVFSLVLAVGVIVAHRTNISRLVEGTEKRMLRKGGRT